MDIRFAVIMIIFLLNAIPCMSQRIQYDLEWARESVPGDVVIEWKIDTEWSQQQVVKDTTKFIVRITSMFEETILQDTVTEKRYRFNTRIGDHRPMIVKVTGLDGSGAAETWLRMDTKVVKVLPMETMIDSLNMLLLNGCFVNVKAMLEDMKRSDLLAQIARQYEIMFPRGYNYGINFFNSYVDPATIKLVQMPYVKKTGNLINALNQATKDRRDKPLDITVLLNVSPENELKDFKVYPASETETIRGLLPLLQFDNRRKEESMVLLKINRSDDKKKKSGYELKNTRALTDPESSGFQKNFYTLTGAVHR